MKRSLTAVANARVPFPLAASWAGVISGEHGDGVKVRCPFGAVEHSDGGKEPALRVYHDHGWCFAENRYFSTVSLLAEVWQVSREDAAVEALARIGYKPADYAHLWEQAAREPEPDRGALARALTDWCFTECPDWAQRRVMPEVAWALGRCLGLLPGVHSADDCLTWLAGSQYVMARVLQST